MAKNEEHQTKIKRGMKQRHLTMIALGGTIGTGLFIASGTTISQAGSIAALIACAVIGHGFLFNDFA